MKAFLLLLKAMQQNRASERAEILEQATLFPAHHYGAEDRLDFGKFRPQQLRANLDPRDQGIFKGKPLLRLSFGGRALAGRLRGSLTGLEL